MTAWGKVRVFTPQLVGFGLTSCLISFAVWLGQHAAVVAMVPTIMVGSLSALVTAITSLNKASIIDRNDWDEFGGCKRCALLERDRDELRQALLTEKAP